MQWLFEINKQTKKITKGNNHKIRTYNKKLERENKLFAKQEKKWIHSTWRIELAYCKWIQKITKFK